MKPGARNSVYTIQAGVAFAKVLVEGIVQRIGTDPLALADVVVFVPTRRAVRTLQEAFALHLGGATLGPQIRALGDLDEDEDFEPGSGDIADAPAIAPLRRRLELAQLVEHWRKASGNELPFAQAVAHAGELGRFLDEVVEQNADLGKLEDLAPGAFAEHWQKVSEFLGIVSRHWPKFLADNGLVEPAARRDALIHRRAARLAAEPPASLVVAAGSTGSIPATRSLLKTIAQLPNGAVILPALDADLDEESWKNIEEGHAQYGLKQLLNHIGVAREDVSDWIAGAAGAANAARRRFLSEALRPPPTTDTWRQLVEEKRADFALALDGLALIEAANPQEEALAIAIALREALETEGRTAALVTPDRGLARRVAAELSRWGIVINDSAGTPLGQTPPAAFMTLLTHACVENFAPIPLLALLKHPLCSGGSETALFRARVRAMERAVLRGIRPGSGLNAIAGALKQKEAPDELRAWFEEFARIVRPLADRMAAQDVPLSEIATLHAKVAETLAATHEKEGAAILWRGEAGEAAARLVAEMIEHGEDIALAAGSHYAELFRELASARVVRPRYGRHPRLHLLGPLEARLQDFDLLILGSLNEGRWPNEATTDPWLSRPMRKALGLEAPERRTGLAAHDFMTLANAPKAILTRSLKQDGTPTTPSRWLLRIRQLAKGLGIAEQLNARSDLLAWAQNIDRGARQERARQPRPCPPISVRPRRLSVTQVETWLRDPYAIYARHILRLKALDPIDNEPGPRERGIAVHAVLEQFLKAFPDRLPEDAYERLLALGREAFANSGAVIALWGPRFERAARWFLDFESNRRAAGGEVSIEIEGNLTLPAPGGAFTLNGRADRIEIHADGSASILDYKTGRIPSGDQIASLFSPQLPLEGAMLLHGAFPGIGAASIREFIHIQLTGAKTPGNARQFDEDATAKAEEALQRLMRRIGEYDRDTKAYVSREAIERIGDRNDYDHLARVKEWILSGGHGQ